MKNGEQQSDTMRWLYYGRDFSDISPWMEISTAVTQRLEHHGIRFIFERCDAVRLRDIHRRGEQPDELLLLATLPTKFQGLFANFKRAALVIGLPFPGIQLPFISIDILSALQHAVHMLVRRGFSRISLIHKEGSRQAMTEQFKQICARSSQVIWGDVIHLPVELHEQNMATQRLAATIKGHHALIVNYPVSAGLLMTALLQKGVKVPGHVEVVAMNTMMYAIRVVPIPIYYPYPVERLAKAIALAAIYYFKHGHLSPLRKMIPLEMIADHSHL